MFAGGCVTSKAISLHWNSSLCLCWRLFNRRQPIIMRLNQVPGCAAALILTAGSTGFVEGFYIASASRAAVSRATLLVSAERGGPSCCTVACPRTTTGALRPHATAACTCGACNVSLREVLVGGLRRRGGAIAAGAEGGEEELDGATAVATIAEFDLDAKTLEELWTRPKKHLMSVGKAGVKTSHVRSLNALVGAHTLVKVKINIPRADLGQVGLQLCGKSSLPAEGGASTGEEALLLSSTLPVDVTVVTNRPSQNMILFAKTEFLDASAKGDVYNSSSN